MTKKDNRILWVDCLKLLCLFWIYLGHMGDNSGAFSPFVWTFHVNALFFASGMMAHRGNKRSVTELIKVRFASMMVPYYVFLILNYAFYFIVIKPEPGTALYQAGLGVIGAKFYEWGGQLWFIPALFLCVIFYRVLFAFQGKIKLPLRLILCFVISEVSSRFCTGPEWNYVPYSVSFCLKYIFWYALGDYVFEYFISSPKKIVKCGTNIIEGVGLLFSLLKYLNIDMYALRQALGKAYEYLEVFLLIMGCIVIAKALSYIPYITKLAKHTLYLCGNEVLVKNAFEYLLTGISLHYVPNGEFGALVYCLILFALVYKFLIPAESSWIHALQQKILYPCQRDNKM